MARLTGTAGRLLGRSKAEVIAARPGDRVLAALELMAAHDIGALVVIDGTRLVGILSERDYARKGELAGRVAREAKVADIMTSDVVSVTPTTSITECNALMHRHRIRHLPVVEGGRVVGILSSRDVLDKLVAEEAKQIHDLETERLMIDTGNY
jgi:CBS domain-containing protein